MHGAIVFQGAFVVACVALVYAIEGRQTRRAADERAQQAHGRRRSLGSVKDEKRAVDGLEEDVCGAVTVRAVSVDGSADGETLPSMPGAAAGREGG